MSKGLESFLEKIKSSPENQTYVDRFLALLIDEPSQSRLVLLYRLGALIVNAQPLSALRVAYMALKEARAIKRPLDEIEVLKLVEASFLSLGKRDKAEVVTRERRILEIRIADAVKAEEGSVDSKETAKLPGAPPTPQRAKVRIHVPEAQQRDQGPSSHKLGPNVLKVPKILPRKQFDDIPVLTRIADYHETPPLDLAVTPSEKQFKAEDSDLPKSSANKQKRAFQDPEKNLATSIEDKAREVFKRLRKQAASPVNSSLNFDASQVEGTSKINKSQLPPKRGKSLSDILQKSQEPKSRKPDPDAMGDTGLQNRGPNREAVAERKMEEGRHKHKQGFASPQQPKQDQHGATPKSRPPQPASLDLGTSQEAHPKVGDFWNSWIDQILSEPQNTLEDKLDAFWVKMNITLDHSQRRYFTHCFKQWQQQQTYETFFAMIAFYFENFSFTVQEYLLNRLKIKSYHGHAWSDYLVGLEHLGRPRHALNMIIKGTEPSSSLELAQISYAHLKSIWEKLSYVGFDWEITEGSQMFWKRLQMRPSPKASAVVCTGQPQKSKT